ncbi:MAG: succinylglutamate desuccinylase/aspartoacylase family protein [Candidatus Dojkabacteria bacterium]|nr:MAG: succinylglutamate desuccinylase/aspartoacylase family protein [Candidatus Dojkabacteria bacterium]
MELKNHIIKFNEIEISIPYYHLVGKEPGSKLFITAGIHGDEVNGVYAVSKVIEWAREANVVDKLKGELYIFPLLNPTGFKKGERNLPEDGKDLNRQFGENLDEIEESISEVVAASLVENFFKKCNMGIDIHDAGDGAVFLPHARIHKNDADDCESCTRELARYFGTEYIIERDGDLNMMAVAMNNTYKVPVITVEIGGAQIIYPTLEQVALRGVQNILAANSMFPGKIVVPEKQYVVSRRIGVRSSVASVLHLKVKLGDRVAKGDRVGWRYVVGEGRNADVLAPDNGVVFSMWPTNLVPADRTFLSVVDVDCKDPQEKGIEVLEDLTVWEYNG